MPFNVLVIDDNTEFINSIRVALKGFQIIFAFSPDDAKNKLTPDIDLVLLDLVFDETNLDKLDGLTFIPYIQNTCRDIPIVIMTNYTSTDITVRAIKSGAVDFFNKKDIQWSEWKYRLENYCKNSARIRELTSQTEELQHQFDDSEIIGSSIEVRFLRQRLRDLAEHSNEISVLLVGETGTGKNLAVKYYRKYSSRKNKPYKEFSISELSESLIESELFGHVKGAFTGATNEKKGLFEEANGGLLFLDEIGDYELRIQKKIMRFIEDKTIIPVGGTTSKKLDVQLMMATNQDILQLIVQGKFREDLYQRINRIKIDLPPLRKRHKDISELTKYYFQHFRIKEKTNLLTISDEVYKVLCEYSWPGNIRELQSVVWDACTHARMLKDSVLQKKHLRLDIFKSEETGVSGFDRNSELDLKIATLELMEIDRVLETTYGNKSESARQLCLNVDQLRYKILKYRKRYPTLVSQYAYIEKYYR